MKPKISSIYESIFSSYKSVRITDENEHEFFFEFSAKCRRKRNSPNVGKRIVLECNLNVTN